jgi:hypothetical protein
MKRIILSLALGILFLTTNFVFAQVSINEVQLLPTENRFIELYNSSNETLDLSNYYLQRKTLTGDFTSLVSKTYFENKSINAGEYFLISRSSLSGADIVLSTLTLTDSNSLQLKNAEGNIVNKIGWGDSNDCSGSCPANPAENKSIQKQIDNTWIISSPTPGLVNSSNATNNNENNETENSNTNTTENNSTSSSSSSSSSQEKKEIVIKNPTIKVKILTNNLAFVGEPLLIKTNILGYTNEVLTRGKLYWNFGDGSSLEQENTLNNKLEHTYYYAGEYLLSLEYYESILSAEPIVTEKIIIKVLPKTVIISQVGSAEDFFIELTNKSTSEIDISNWTLRSSNRIFYIPRNTILMPGKAMRISNKISNFSLADQYSLKLYSKTGDLVFDFNNNFVNTNSINTSKKITSVKKIEAENKPIEENLNEESTSDLLSANVLESVKKEKTSNRNSYLFYGIFILLLFLSILSIYFIRQKTSINKAKAGDDFEILDE